MPKQQAGTRSRNVFPRNMCGKNGAACKQTAAKFFKAASYAHRKPRQADLVQLAKADVQLDDKWAAREKKESSVIVASAPVKKAETRFTLPDVPANADLFLQHYLRTHHLLHDCINELKTCMKVRVGAVDPERVEML